MSRKEPGFAERLQTAAKAKQAQLEKIRATALANDAQSTERQAARVETAEARKIRAAEHKHSNRVAAELRDARRAAEKARQAQAVTEEKARKDAEHALANQTGDFDYGRASAQLAEAAAQLATLRKMKNRAGRG